jgi:lysophospholipase L1-like esterase
MAERDVVTYPYISTVGEVDLNTPLRKWHAALANRHYSPAKIAIIGDSLSEGIGASKFGRGWVPMMTALLRNRFPVTGVVGGNGFVASWDNPGYGGGDPAYVYPVNQSNGSFSETQGFSLKSNTLLATNDQLSYMFTGTSIHVWYIKQTNGGTFSVTIDGVIVQASVVTAGTSGTGVWTSAALTAGSHTIIVKRIAGGGTASVLVNGFRVFNGDETKGIQIFNGSQSGLISGQFAINAANGDKWAPWLSVIQPQLVIVELGLNDWSTDVTMVTTKANLKSIIATIRAKTTTDPSIVIYAATEANSGTYASTFDQLHGVWTEVVAEDPKTALFDAGTRIPAPIVDSTDGYYYDLLHPSDKGHSAIAEFMTAFLSPR